MNKKKKHIQEQRNKIRAKRTKQAFEDAKEYKQPKVKPSKGRRKVRLRNALAEWIRSMLRKGEEKNTYRIVTKREYTFSYTIRAKNEEDAMIRTLKYVVATTDQVNIYTVQCSWESHSSGSGLIKLKSYRR